MKIEEQTCENCYYLIHKVECPVPFEVQGQISSTGTSYCPYWTQRDSLAHTLKSFEGLKREEQVVCLELAKELKELGVKQDSLWFWNNYITSKPYLSGSKQFEDELATDGTYIQYSVSAYTVAELGEMLPFYITSWHTARMWICTDVISRYGENATFEAEKEADARAKMLIYLIKEGIIEKC